MVAPGDGDGVGPLLADIPQSGNTLGEPGAPVTLEYFGDLECPYCRQFSLEVLPSLIARWVRASRLRIAYRALQTATREPEVFVAQQVAALAAGRQEKEWDFVETFFEQQGEEGSGYVTESYLQGIASQIPHLDLQRWTRDREDPALPKQIADDAEAAGSVGLAGTPSFLLGASAGAMKVFSPTSTASFDGAIEELVAA